MFRVVGRVHVILCITLLLAAASLAISSPVQIQAQTADSTLVYHQITAFPEETGGVGYPVLSADGSNVVFSNAPGTGDPTTPNRILVIGADGGGMTEVDSYQSLCYCGSMVDISADRGTIVSTEGIQLRIADANGARELVVLGGEITALVISGDGETVFFIVRRDTATVDGATPIARGIWAIDADGSDLRLVAGAEDVANALGVAVDETGCFHSDGHPLDVSDARDRVVFGAYAAGSEHIFAADVDGEDVRTLLDEGASYVQRVAISGNGDLVAFDVILSTAGGINEVGVLPFGGGTPDILATNVASGFDEPLQLSENGSRLLISPNALLIDTATGDSQLLATSITGVGGNLEAVLPDVLDRATMNAEADRFLYAMRTSRCANCVNLQEQLATLDIGPPESNEAPVISGASIDPATIELNAATDTTVEVTVDTTGIVLGVGFAALLDGSVVDANVGFGLVLLDDGEGDDASVSDGVYTVTGIVHTYRVLREHDDVGPRTVRIAVEVTGSDGRRHATAVDIGTLTVSP